MPLHDNEKNYISFEYQEKNIDGKFLNLYLDNYPHFGWQLSTVERSTTRPGKVLLKIKRDRHIANKQELVRLQRKFESETNQIQRFEKEKTFLATMISILVGPLGSIFLAISVMILHNNSFLSTIIGILGIIAWILPYWIYRDIKNRKAIKLSDKINRIYDLIDDTCQQAHSLSNI